MPTCSGKSACFLLPGLVERGITVVVFPLKSVMFDQVNLGCFIFDFFLKFWGDARIICSYDIMRLSTKFELKKIKFDMRACRFSQKIGIFSHFFSNNFFSTSYFFHDACT